MNEIIIMYLPTILVAIATILNFIKTLSVLKNVFKGAEIKKLNNDLENIKTKLNEQITVNKQLLNALSKVKIYDENNENNENKKI